MGRKQKETLFDVLLDVMRGPVNQFGPLQKRQMLWNAIREVVDERGRFTVREITGRTPLRVDMVRSYVRGLVAAGIVRQAAAGGRIGEATQWELARDAGAEAPRLREDGSPVIQGQGRENMWLAMKIMHDFSPRELAVAATMPDCQVRETTAAEYLLYLHRAGYLARQNGRYRLLPGAWTGPFAPMIQRTKRVWDPNLKEIRWTSEEESHDE